jgi:rare lipoprotein A
MARRRFLVALLGMLAGCRRKKKVHLPPPVPAVVGATETGRASWYGHPYHGRRTSNGEVYNMEAMTAAHLSLPFGTWVRVTNLDNGRRTDVRINDRGPFVKNRVIDLSKAAAREIAMLGPGTARVRLEVVAKPGAAEPRITAGSYEGPSTAGNDTGQESMGTNATPTPSGQGACEPGPYYGVQVGSFREFENAQKMQARTNGRYGASRILRKDAAAGPLYRVVVGPAANYSDAERIVRRLGDDKLAGYVTLVSEVESLDCL